MLRNKLSGKGTTYSAISDEVDTEFASRLSGLRNNMLMRTLSCWKTNYGHH